MRIGSLSGLKIGLAVLMVSASGMTLADTNHYRWINEHGEPVYSDRPPPKGTDYQVISSSSGFKRDVSGEQGAVPLESKAGAGGNQGAAGGTQQAASKKNTELCERAKMNLIALEGVENISVRDDKGELRLLSPEEKQTQREIAGAQARIYCE